MGIAQPEVAANNTGSLVIGASSPGDAGKRLPKPAREEWAPSLSGGLGAHFSTKLTKRLEQFHC